MLQQHFCSDGYRCPQLGTLSLDRCHPWWMIGHNSRYFALLGLLLSWSFPGYLTSPGSRSGLDKWPRARSPSSPCRQAGVSWTAGS